MFGRTALRRPRSPSAASRPERVPPAGTRAGTLQCRCPAFPDSRSTAYSCGVTFVTSPLSDCEAGLLIRGAMITETQELLLRLIEKNSFNNFPGPTVARDLRANQPLWRSVLMTRHSGWLARKSRATVG